MGPRTVLLHCKAFHALNHLKSLESSLKAGLRVRTVGRQHPPTLTLTAGLEPTGASEPVCFALMVALLSCRREDVR